MCAGWGCRTMTDLRKAMSDMDRWVLQDRKRREVSLAVKTCMRRIVSEFSFQREEGLRELMKLVHKLLATGVSWGEAPLGDGKEEDVTVAERVLRAVFPKTPPPSVQHPMCLTTPTERRLAMVSLEGLCALSRREQQAFVDGRGTTTVRDELVRRGASGAAADDPAEVATLCACLDALLVSCLDNPTAQHQVVDLDIPALLCGMLKRPGGDVNLQYKILEFLAVLLVVAQLGGTASAAPLPAYRGPVPSSDLAQQPRRRLLRKLEELLGSEILGKVQNCVTVRNVSGVGGGGGGGGGGSISLSPSGSGSGMASKRTTARERDLRLQAEIIAQLAQMPSGGGGASAGNKQASAGTSSRPARDAGGAKSLSGGGASGRERREGSFSRR